ncbi:MAG: protein-L-isoaspartate O-methyltransferase [Alphaproteobacteria bacterium]|jgi:protein-L-isoaspartate(D-aspartate) O-methyltransferase|nr:protein-L-isoaspartate O-methyltransferase [Alphaproteobacteria bacterium]
MAEDLFAVPRHHMVRDQLKPVGVTQESILAAFGGVPREAFVSEVSLPLAYADVPVPLPVGVLPDPATHARLLALAEPRAADVALEIGASGGYGAAVLAPLVATVIAREADADALAAAQKHWDALILPTVVGRAGWTGEADAPFDLIVIAGAVPAVPEALVALLSPTGRLVTVLRASGAPIGQGVLVRPVAGGGFSVYPAFDAALPYHPAFAA